MNGLKTLVLMQLKDKIDFSFLKSTKQTIFKIVLSIIKFAVITGLIFLGFYVLSYLRLTSLLPGIPLNFFVIIFSIMLAVSIIVCSFGLVKSLYHAKDNALLLTFPADRSIVFISKLIVYYIYEFIRNLSYLLPLFVAYALINSLPFYFYFWLIVIMILVTAIPVIIGALISIPLLFIFNFVKQYKWLEYSLTLIFITGVVIGLIFIINAIPANIDLIGSWGTTFWQIQDVLNQFATSSNPFYWISVGLVGERYGIANMMFTTNQLLGLLYIFAGIIVVGLITYLLVRPLFFKMASSPFEYKKVKVVKQFKNSKISAFLSTVKKDLFINLRTPEKFYALLLVVIGMPIAILLLNKIYAAMDTRLIGGYMTLAFNILMILLISLSSNINIAHIYSEEGGSAYLNKTNPKPYLQTLFSKLFINIVLVSFSLLASTIIFTTFAGLGVWDTILIFLILECVYISHILWCAELDIMNPQNEQYQTTGSHVSNPNDMKATLTTFLLSALFAFITYFLITDSPTTIWYKILIIAGAFTALRIWLYINKIKVYYKEK